MNKVWEVDVYSLVMGEDEKSLPGILLLDAELRENIFVLLRIDEAVPDSVQEVEPEPQVVIEPGGEDGGLQSLRTLGLLVAGPLVTLTRLRLESSISKSNTYKNPQSHGVDRHHRSQELSDRKRSAGVFLIFSSGRKHTFV